MVIYLKESIRLLRFRHEDNYLLTSFFEPVPDYLSAVYTVYGKRGHWAGWHLVFRRFARGCFYEHETS